MQRYEPSEIEPKWQEVWVKTGIHRAIDFDPKPKYYMLVEFPYPSGAGLHAGHAREYTLGDVIARHKRMQGYNVLFPMGYDAFGLPTENYAIKNKIAPQTATADNIAIFRRQYESLGYSIDWDREVNTTEVSYYHWTQWLFLQFVKEGLAYQAETTINWCPKCKTGLANEEVSDGKHERCGTPVEKKLLKQWLLKITKYADRLIEGLKTVDYPSRIADQQINWIGRSEGAEITFAIKASSGLAIDTSVTVYTTRADTLFGATFIVLSPELAQRWNESGWSPDKAVTGYIKDSLAQQELTRQERTDKTGVNSGLTAIHPLTGEAVPVWVADYVLGSYGTGAIMAVPAHDERDHDFAVKFGLPIKVVVEPITGSKQNSPIEKHKIVALVENEAGEVLTINWGAELGGRLLVGGTVEDEEDPLQTARREVAEETGYTDLQLVETGTETIHHEYYAHSKNQPVVAHVKCFKFKLGSSKPSQPKLEDNEVGKFSVEWVSTTRAEQEISDPLHQFVLGKFTRGKVYTGYGPLTGSGEFDGLAGDAAKAAIVASLHESGAAKVATKFKLRDWIFSRQHYWGEPIPIIHCPVHGAVPVPVDQLPVTLPDVASYEPTDDGKSPLALVSDWVNTTCPVCGEPAKRETDTMPNWAGSSWYYLRYMDPRNSSDFAERAKLDYWGQVDLYLGGMEHTTLHLLYSRFWHQFFYDQGLVPTPEPYAARRGQGIVLASDGRKMSKSLGNVVNPTEIISRYGADSLRLYLIFMAPYDETTPWSDERLGGVNRFLYRVWSLAQVLITAPVTDSVGNDGALVTEVDRATHKTLKKVHDDLHEMRFNTVVSTLMEHLNYLSKADRLARLIQHPDLASRILRQFLLMLAPLAPHITEELWHQLGEEGSIHVAAWPAYDPELIKDELVEIVIQINGKRRGTIVVSASATDDEVVSAAKVEPHVAQYLKGAEVKKTIVVPRKIVNFVINAPK